MPKGDKVLAAAISIAEEKLERLSDEWVDVTLEIDTGSFLAADVGDEDYELVSRFAQHQ